MPRSKCRRRGFSIPWLAIGLLVFIGFVGLAIDTGRFMLTAHQLQNAADASALAGALQLKRDLAEAHSSAINVAAENTAASDPVILAPNESNVESGDVVIGRYDRDTDTFVATLDAPNAVKVVARRTTDSPGGPVPLFFGSIFGVADVDVQRTAIAMNQGGTGAGLIALCDSCECGLEVSGTVEVNVEGGAIQVNSEAECAICGNGNPTIDAPEVNVVGEDCFTPNVDVTGEVNTGQPPMSDPLASLPEPDWAEMPDLGAITEAGTYGPGYYSGGIRLVGSEAVSVTLLPGIYVLDGDGLQIGGDTTFLAEYVMCYVKGTGYVDINGTGEIHMTPPAPEEVWFDGADVYEHVTIFQARDNTNESRIIGTGLLNLEGTLYFPAAFLEIGGTGDGFGNQLIAWQIWAHGNGEITIVYDGFFPAPGDFIFLVE